MRVIGHEHLRLWQSLAAAIVAGCGIATALVFLAMFIAMLVYGWFSRTTQRYKTHPDSYRLNLKDCWQIVSIGTPIAFSIFFEVTLFACIPLAIVHLGPIMVAGHQIAQNYSGIVFMLPLSLGMATTIRVGHLVGQQSLTELQRALAGVSPGSVAYERAGSNLQVLEQTLRELQPVLKMLNQQSNALLINASEQADPQPRKAKP